MQSMWYHLSLRHKCLASHSIMGCSSILLWQTQKMEVRLLAHSAMFKTQYYFTNADSAWHLNRWDFTSPSFYHRSKTSHRGLHHSRHQHRMHEKTCIRNCSSAGYCHLWLEVKHITKSTALVKKEKYKENISLMHTFTTWALHITVIHLWSTRSHPSRLECSFDATARKLRENVVNNFLGNSVQPSLEVQTIISTEMVNCLTISPLH